MWSNYFGTGFLVKKAPFLNTYGLHYKARFREERFFFDDYHLNLFKYGAYNYALTSGQDSARCNASIEHHTR